MAALQELRNGSGELDVLDSPSDLPSGITQDLAVLSRHNSCQVIASVVEQFTKGEQYARSLREGALLPGVRRRSGARDHRVGFRLRGQVNICDVLAGGGIENWRGGSRSPLNVLAVDPM
jgi:hypothetical protein